MSAATEISIESLQTQLAERDATILTIKDRTKAFVEKLKADHGAALLAEQTSRQQFQVRQNINCCDSSIKSDYTSSLRRESHLLQYLGQVGIPQAYFFKFKRGEDSLDKRSRRAKGRVK